MKIIFISTILFWFIFIHHVVAEAIVMRSPPDSTLTMTAFSECDNFAWIGTNHGVVKINKKTGRKWHYTKKDSALPNDLITDIVCLHNGQVYIGTPDGILMWDNYSFLLITTENSNIPDNNITSLGVDKDEILWIGTNHDGLMKASGESIRPFSAHPIEFNNESIYALTFDSNNMWVSFANDGIALLQQGEWKSFNLDQFILFIKRGNNDNFLIKMPDKGAYYCKGTEICNLVPDSMCNSNPYAYFNAEYTRCFVSYKDSLYLYNPNKPEAAPAHVHFTEFIKSLSAKSPSDRIKNKADIAEKHSANSVLLSLLME